MGHYWPALYQSKEWASIVHNAGEATNRLF